MAELWKEMAARENEDQKERTEGSEKVVGRRYIFIHEIISTEEEKLLEKMRKLPIYGRKTKPQTVKEVRKLIDDVSFQIARKYNVLVNYPHMNIQGKEVVLGEASILLPSGRFVGWDELKEMEVERENKYNAEQTRKRQVQKGYRRAEWR